MNLQTLQGDSKDSKTNPLPEITTYSALRPHLSLIVLKGLRVDGSPGILLLEHS
jgi:hypothetical protein